MAAPKMLGTPSGSTDVANKAYVDALPTGATVALNSQTANYTLVLTDQGKAVEMSSTSARTVTVPPNSSVAFPVGTVIEIARINTGSVTVVAGAGVTINSPSTLVLRARYSSVSIRKSATDTWLLAGDTT